MLSISLILVRKIREGVQKRILTLEQYTSTRF
nr:MAG TPA: hypothetical protein [Caudoviricetes sp.]